MGFHPSEKFGDTMRSARIKNCLTISAIISFIAIVGSIIALIQFKISSGDEASDHIYIHDHIVGYVSSYLFMVFNSFAITVILIILAFFTECKQSNKLFNIIGICFIVPYPLLATFAYGSQFLIVPYLLKSEGIIGSDLVDIFIFTTDYSVTYVIDLIGYAFLGIGSLFVGFKYLYEKLPIKMMGILLYVTGILSIIAIILHGFQLRSSGEIASMASGILTLLFLITIFIARNKLEYRLE